MKLYFIAARIIDSLENGQKNTKSQVYNAAITNKKALYAVVHQTLRYSEVLKLIIDNAGFFKQQKLIRGNLAYVLVYELLFGTGLKSIKGKYLCILNKYKPTLKAELAKLKMKENVWKNEDLIKNKKDGIPRYARINTLKTRLEELVKYLQSHGYEMITAATSTNQFVEQVNGLKLGQFLVDVHVDNLLVFAPGTDLHDNDLYTSGRLILQDKASCLPAVILDPPPGSDIIDACAAPGNKTTHLAAIINNTGHIFAVDQDRSRIETMRKLVSNIVPTSHQSSIQIIHTDFLQIDPQLSKYKNVQYILVDPSCSGSGIVNRLEKAGGDAAHQSATNASRLKSLSNFQERILTHALKFPNVTRVVYSTCSVHVEENEEVVGRVLSNSDVSDRFELKEITIPGWSERGMPCDGLENASYCIRASPEQSLTNGFFVALIERRNKLNRPTGKHKKRKHKTTENK